MPISKAPFAWEPGDEVLVANGGLGLVGMLFNSLPLGEQVNAMTVTGAEQPKICHRDVLASYLGLLVQGNNEFDHVEAFRADPFFAVSLGLAHVPSSPTLRQRLDQAASSVGDEWQAAILSSSDQLLQAYAQCRPLLSGGQEYVPLDIDVSPFDNGKTKKEGVSGTYKGCDGFAPIFAYVGLEGLTLAAELREGKQHCQNGTPAFLENCLRRARRIVPAAHLLVRLDSGHDSCDNIDMCERYGAAFLIKRNLRKESLEGWLKRAQSEGQAQRPRPGKTGVPGQL